MGVPMRSSPLLDLIPRSSAGRLDESGPLSASDLIELQQNISDKAEGIKTKVQSTVAHYRTEFLRTINQSNETVENVEHVAEGLKNVLDRLGEREAEHAKHSRKLLSPRGSQRSPREGVADRQSDQNAISNRAPVDIEICRLAEEVCRLKGKVKEREEALVVVESISSIHALILDTETKFTPQGLVDAAEGLVLLQEKLGLRDVQHEVTRVHHHDVKVFKLLQDAWLQRYEKFIDLLEDLLSRAIVLDETKSELSVSQRISGGNFENGSGGGQVELASIFTALDVLGGLDFRLAKFGDSIFRHILSPLLRHSLAVISTAVETSNERSSQRSILRWKFTAQTADVQPEILYPKIVQVVRFLNEHVLGSEKGRMARFGRVVWPRLAEAVVATCLSKAVPIETAQLKDFEQVADLTAKFEINLADEGLIPNFDPALGDRLTHFASDVEVHFASKRKKYVLAKARDLLMQASYSLPKSTWIGFHCENFSQERDRSVYLLQDPCAISILASSLMDMVHDVLEDACLSTPRTASEFFATARDVLLLFRAIIPFKLDAGSDRMQVAALCHNDCLYIGHEILTFVYQYRSYLPESLKPSFTFVDLVPIFRQMAEDVLEQVMKDVRSEILQGLDHANGFQYTDEEQQFQLAQQSLDKVFDTFATVKKHLQPVLGHGEYQKLIGKLINVVSMKILHDILALTDIAVQETVNLQKILMILQERFPRFLAPAVVDVSAKEQVEEREVDSLVLSWRKVKKLSDILDMSLASISREWESEDLARAGFTSGEVQRLILAVFSETAFRNECLQRIRQTSR